MENAARNPVTHIPLAYRMPYMFAYNRAFDENYSLDITGKLNQVIRTIHKKYRNFNPDGKYLIFAHGASDIASTLFKVWSEIEGKLIYSYLHPPYYYSLSPRCTEVCNCMNSHNTTLDPSQVAEIVVSPHNPTGAILTGPHYKTKNWAKDLVYYWPHISSLGYSIVPDNSPIACFSFTKFTGHAAIRFAWAFVSNETLAQHIRSKISQNYMHLSAANLYHALTILTEINENGYQFFDWTMSRLADRWSRFEAVLAQQTVFKCESVRGTQYGWLASGRSEEELMNAFGQVKMSPLYGSLSGTPGYVRINMLDYESVFTLALEGVLRVARILEAKDHSEF